MGKIYVGQTDLTIRMETFKELSNTAEARIMFKKPSGLEGSFIAVIADSNKGIIQFSVTSVNDINEQGTWTFWCKLLDNQGLISIGEPSKFVIYSEGN